jgi:hypothetical protein
LLQARHRVPLGAVANAELDGEIGAQPDEQDRERDGDRIQRMDQQQAEPRRNGKPTASVIATARTSRAQRNASQRISRTMPALTTPLVALPSRSVANSVSAMGTGPVNRTFALNSPASLARAPASRTAAVACPPGSYAL